MQLCRIANPYSQFAPQYSLSLFQSLVQGQVLPASLAKLSLSTAHAKFTIASLSKLLSTAPTASPSIPTSLLPTQILLAVAVCDQLKDRTDFHANDSWNSKKGPFDVGSSTLCCPQSRSLSPLDCSATLPSTGQKVLSYLFTVHENTEPKWSFRCQKAIHEHCTVYTDVLSLQCRLMSLDTLIVTDPLSPSTCSEDTG